MNSYRRIFRGAAIALLLIATAVGPSSHATATRSAGVQALAVKSSSSIGSVTLSGWATFSGAIIASGTSRVGNTTDPSAGISGADLIGAQLIYRPELADFLLRWQVASSCTQCGIPSVGAAPAAVVGDPRILYVLRTSLGGTPVEIRAQSFGATQQFGLFICQTEAACTLSQSLQGGYGTTGEAVVADLPLSTIAAAGLHVGEGSKLAAPIAFTAVAPYLGPEEIPQEYEDSIAMTNSATVTVPVKSVRITANGVTRTAGLKNGYFTVVFPRSALPHGRLTIVTTRTCLGTVCAVQKFPIYA